MAFSRKDMQLEVDITIKDRFVNDYKEGYPLISLEAIENIDKLSTEGLIVNLYDKKRKFIAKGYYGRQNKGYGWIFTKEKNEAIDKSFFAKKIKEAIEYRKEYYEDETTTTFRVLNGEGDGIGGLTIDYYDGYYVFTWYSMGIYSFKEDILEGFKSIVEYKGIYQKKRFNDNGQYLEDDTDYVCGDRGEFPLIVKQDNINYAVYLDDGPMVGVFLDQKEVRKTIRDKYAKGKTVLNTFSYTGAFSVAAALGGVKKTTSVDLANRSRPKTIEQFEVNGIDASTQEIVVQDVFNYFKFAIKKKMMFDMVVVDPPSFARSKKHTFSVAKDYGKLLKEIIQITNKGGVIVASTNYANFGMGRFRQFIDKAFKELKGKYQIDEVFTLPKDFRVNDKFKQGDYLKVVFIKKIK